MNSTAPAPTPVYGYTCVNCKHSFTQAVKAVNVHGWAVCGGCKK